jgi:hypothetical protein
VDAVPGGAGARAVALPERARYHDGSSVGKCPSGERFGSDDRTNLAAAIVEGHAKAVRERRRRTNRRARDSHACPFTGLPGGTGGQFHRLREIDGLASNEVRFRELQRPLTVPTGDGPFCADVRAGGPGRDGRRIQVQRDAAAGVLHETAATAFERTERRRQGSLDHHRRTIGP